MKPSIRILLTVTVAMMFSATAQAATLSGPFPKDSIQDPRKRLELGYRCQANAIWPAKQSPAYRNASVIRREQITNNPGTEVRAMRTLCWRMAKATEAEAVPLMRECTERLSAITRQFGAEAQSHVARQTQICRSLMGNAFKV